MAPLGAEELASLRALLEDEGLAAIHEHRA